MSENITNRPGTEETVQGELKRHAVAAPSEQVQADEEVDESSLPKGMRDTVEISTLMPND